MDEINSFLLEQLGQDSLERATGAFACTLGLILLAAIGFYGWKAARRMGSAVGGFFKISDIGAAVLKDMDSQLICGESLIDDSLMGPRCIVTCRRRWFRRSSVIVQVGSANIDDQLTCTDRRSIRRKFRQVVRELGKMAVAKQRREILNELKRV